MVPLTPTVKMCIALCFADIIGVRKHKPKVGERDNLKSYFEGDVIITDEFLELLEKKTVF